MSLFDSQLVMISKFPISTEILSQKLKINFKRTAAQVNELQESHDEYIRLLSPNSQQSVSTYVSTGAYIQPFNFYLRGLKKIDGAKIVYPEGIKQEIRSLQIALKEAPILPPNLWLFRGIVFYRQSFSLPAIGQIIQEKGFMSTSWLPPYKYLALTHNDGVYDYTPTRILMRIQTPKGLKGLSLGSSFNNKGEREILLPHGLRYKVVRYSQVEIDQVRTKTGELRDVEPKTIIIMDVEIVL